MGGLQNWQKRILHSVLYTDQETGQTIIAGMGELHLEIIVDRLLREFKVEANVGAPQVAYKETLQSPLMWTASMQSSPADGQYGHCKVKFEPMDPNGEETFKLFDTAVVGGSIPKEYIPAVGEGIEEASQSWYTRRIPCTGRSCYRIRRFPTMKSIHPKWYSILPVHWHSRMLCPRQIRYWFEPIMKVGQPCRRIIWAISYR